jgi:hypothetical protein
LSFGHGFERGKEEGAIAKKKEAIHEGPVVVH